MVRIRVTVYVSSRCIVRGTLNDLSCPYFLTEVMVRAHFVTLIEVGMHVSAAIPGLTLHVDVVGQLIRMHPG